MLKSIDRVDKTQNLRKNIFENVIVNELVRNKLKASREH